MPQGERYPLGHRLITPEVKEGKSSKKKNETPVKFSEARAATDVQPELKEALSARRASRKRSIVSTRGSVIGKHLPSGFSADRVDERLHCKRTCNASESG